MSGPACRGPGRRKCPATRETGIAEVAVHPGRGALSRCRLQRHVHGSWQPLTARVWCRMRGRGCSLMSRTGHVDCSAGRGVGRATQAPGAARSGAGTGRHGRRGCRRRHHDLRGRGARRSGRVCSGRWRRIRPAGDCSIASTRWRWVRSRARAAAREVVWAQRAELSGQPFPPAGRVLHGLVIDLDASIVVCH
jgi:hypothetical protein